MHSEDRYFCMQRGSTDNLSRRMTCHICVWDHSVCSVLHRFIVKTCLTAEEWMEESGRGAVILLEMRGNPGVD